MKQIITVLAIVSLISLAMPSCASPIFGETLQLPITVSADATAEAVTGFNIYQHDPGQANWVQIGTNVSVQTFTGTNYFPLGKVVFGAQFCVTQVMPDGTETSPSDIATNIFTAPPAVTKPVKR
jgi:hypothetical protein